MSALSFLLFVAMAVCDDSCSVDHATVLQTLTSAVQGRTTAVMANTVQTTRDHSVVQVWFLLYSTFQYIFIIFIFYCFVFDGVIW